ncbi:MAG: IS200/IS605 family transposase [Pyrinomonadaceae bacterium]|nr:IS200/IS605 family transposase [Pyrinomonadaceae bacterium]
MANTYSSLFYHFVFSTKFRKRIIKPDFENRLWTYLGGIARKHDIKPIQIGGVEDHIHALLLSPPKYSVSQIAKIIKSDSSKWVHQEFPNKWAFGWQDGYSAFSVSRSIVPRVVRYIRNQRQHHENVSFEDEYLELLKLHEIDTVDDSYVFE